VGGGGKGGRKEEERKRKKEEGEEKRRRVGSLEISTRIDHQISHSHVVPVGGAVRHYNSSGVSQCVEVVECCKGQRYQTFTTYQLQYVEQLYNNSRRSFHSSPLCLSTDVSPIVFKGLMCCHGTVRPARAQEKGVLQDILKGLSKDRF